MTIQRNTAEEQFKSLPSSRLTAEDIAALKDELSSREKVLAHAQQAVATFDAEWGYAPDAETEYVSFRDDE